MQVNIEHLKHSRIKATIAAPASTMAKAADTVFEHLASHTALKGFRAGKAPRHMLASAIGSPRLLSGIMDEVLPEMLEKALSESSITIIEQPHYDIQTLPELDSEGRIKPDSELVFTAEADTLPTVTVGDYRKLKVKPAAPKQADDKTVKEVLNQLAEQQVSYRPVERAAKKDDRVEIDFTGKRNGLIEERMSSKHHPVVIGSEVMIPGFEDRLIGHKAGDSFSFEITFPKDYRAKDLAGSPAVFEVRVHEVAERIAPEVTDEFAKQFGQQSVSELKDAIKREQQESFEAEAKRETENKVIDDFLKLVKVDVPESLVRRELERQLDALRHQVSGYGLNFNDYLSHLKKTEEQLVEEMRPSAEKAVTVGLGLGEVVKREEIKSGDDAGAKAIEKLVEIATKQYGERATTAHKTKV